jgi:uncharacterized cupredoxin-like copper-binding protein
MIRIFRTIAATAFLGSAMIISATGLSHADPGHSEKFSASEPGSPNKSARTIQVSMRERDGKMLFAPDRIAVRKGEQIRFIIRNDGALQHEFVLASVPDNDHHAELMRKNPHMRHKDPNAEIAKPGETTEMLWRFNKAGTFEFACLIPGHREAGMRGTVTVH